MHVLLQLKNILRYLVLFGSCAEVLCRHQNPLYPLLCLVNLVTYPPRKFISWGLKLLGKEEVKMVILEGFQYAIDISTPRLTLAFAQTVEKINY